MGKQVKIFDLLSKKQSLTVFKNQKKKNQLSQELKNAVSYKKRLLEILDSVETNESKKTVSQIKSESWYNLKIQDELNATKNKIDFLSLEIKNQTMRIAIATEKQKKFRDKKKHFNEIEMKKRENNRESTMPTIINNRSKI